MNGEEPTQFHKPVTDATIVDYTEILREDAARLARAAHVPPALIDFPDPPSPVADLPPIARERHEALRKAAQVDWAPVVEQTVRDVEDTMLGDIDGWKPTGLVNGDSVSFTTTQVVGELPAPVDYSDVDDAVLRSINTAQMLASLRVSGEQIDPAATEATVRRIRELRLALGGVGQVGQHFNAVGTPVGDQVAIVLSAHEVNALIMRLTGKVRFETI